MLFKKSMLAALGVIALLLMPQAYASDGYPKSMGGAGDDGAAMIPDGNGNQYFSGYFEGSTDVDPGPGVVTLSGAAYNNWYISKMDSSGNFLWVKQFYGVSSFGMKMNSSGHIFVAGNFNGTVDFDPGPGVESLTSLGQADIYILELDNDANFVKVARIGNAKNNVVSGFVFDTNDAMYLTGNFSGAVDFDPGVGSEGLTSAGIGLSTFILKLDAAGNYLWVKALGGSGGASVDAAGITLGADGNVYTVGYFNDTADFDPGSSIANLMLGAPGTMNAFISKLDTNGNYVWAKSLKTTVSSSASRIVADSGGNVYISGTFRGAVDFDPGADTAVLTALGYSDIFIVKLNAAGSYQWAKAIGGTGFESGGIVLDNNDNPYVYGQFSGEVDFDSSAASQIRKSTGYTDAFMVKLDSNGNYVLATTWGGIGDDAVTGINFDTAGNALVVGIFHGVVDFDPDKFSTTFLSSVGKGDIFIAKFGVDSDNDGYADIIDGFPNDNTRSADRDNDGIDDLVDIDNDNDGMSDDYEIQYGLNPSNNTDAAIDSDGDSLTNLQEYLMGTSPNNQDSDGDTIRDATDLFPTDPDDYLDFDNDGVGDNADVDDDNDGVVDAIDNCPHIVNMSQLDSDGDGFGNACDALPMNPSESKDSDSDGVGDNHDNCTLTVNPDQKNRDGDSLGDVCDYDNDNDHVSDSQDDCPGVYNFQKDDDHNGIGDACEIRAFGFYNNLLGSAVAMMDMDKDGYADILVSSPSAAVSFDGKVSTNVGVIQLISGATGAIQKIYFGAGRNAHFGSAVLGVTDQTGDGMPDFLVGEPDANVATNVSGNAVVIKKAGRVALYSGVTGVFIKAVAEGKVSGTKFGASLAMGKVNGDAIADLVVGSPLANASTTVNGKSVTVKQAGQITVFKGFSNKELYTRGGSQAGEHFGAAVAVDAAHQILVGSPQRDVKVTVGSKVATLVDAGSAQIFDGANNTAPAVATVYGIHKGDRFGSAVSSFRGDINHDGSDDWAVGIPGDSGYVITDCHGSDENYYCRGAPQKNVGSVLVLSGNQAQQIKFYEGESNSGTGTGSNYGTSVAAYDDIGADGINDLIIGAPTLRVSYQMTYQMKNAGMLTGFSGKHVGSGLLGEYQ